MKKLITSLAAGILLVSSSFAEIQKEYLSFGVRRIRILGQLQLSVDSRAWNSGRIWIFIQQWNRNYKGQDRFQRHRRNGNRYRFCIQFLKDFCLDAQHALYVRFNELKVDGDEIARRSAFLFSAGYRYTLH